MLPTGLVYEMTNFFVLKNLLYRNLFLISNIEIILVADKTADKKSKDTDENKRKRSRAKSISGYRR